MKSSKLILKMIAICFAVVAIPVLTSAQSVVPPTPIYSMSGLVGITRGETVGIHFTNVGRYTRSVRLYFLDAEGRILKSSAERVMPGKSVNIYMSYAEVGKGYDRVLVRAVARFGDPPSEGDPPGESDPPAEADPPGADTAVCAVEAFNEATGKTSFSLLVPAVRDPQIWFAASQLGGN